MPEQKVEIRVNGEEIELVRAIIGGEIEGGHSFGCYFGNMNFAQIMMSYEQCQRALIKLFKEQGIDDAKMKVIFRLAMDHSFKLEKEDKDMDNMGISEFKAMKDLLDTLDGFEELMKKMRR